jgi:hypothetical protein
MRRLRLTQPRLTALHLLEPGKFVVPTPLISAGKGEILFGPQPSQSEEVPLGCGGSVEP